MDSVEEVAVGGAKTTTTEENQQGVAETYILTAYCPCEKCCGKWANNRPLDASGKEIVYTASGTIAKEGRTIAVDTRKIPYGTKVVIDGICYVAEDCGGAIKDNKIDVFFESHEKAVEFGKQTKEVLILKEGVVNG